MSDLGERVVLSGLEADDVTVEVLYDTGLIGTRGQSYRRWWTLRVVGHPLDPRRIVRVKVAVDSSYAYQGRATTEVWRESGWTEVVMVPGEAPPMEYAPSGYLPEDQRVPNVTRWLDDMVVWMVDRTLEITREG